MVKQQKSSDLWHIRITVMVNNDELWEEVTDKIKAFCVSLGVHANTKRFVCGKEIGKKKGRLHWHVHLETNKMVSDATQRKRLNEMIKIDNVKYSLGIVKKSAEQNMRYCIKTEIFHYVGYNEEEVKKAHNSWVPDKNFKQKKESVVSMLLAQAHEKELDLSDSYAVCQFVTAYYRDKKKGYNEYQVESTIRGMLLHTESGFNEQVHRMYMRLQK